MSPREPTAVATEPPREEGAESHGPAASVAYRPAADPVVLAAAAASSCVLLLAALTVLRGPSTSLVRAHDSPRCGPEDGLLPRQPPPTVIIMGIGDSGTRGVKLLLNRLGVRMCDAVNPSEDNELTMPPHELIPALLRCSNGHISASGYARCDDDCRAAGGGPFSNATALEADGVARTWRCLGADDARAAAAEQPAPWGFKNPRHIYLLPVVERLFGAATTPLLVARDPRDICSGTNQDQYVAFTRLFSGVFGDCFGWWASTWRDVLEGDAAARFVLVRIEDLVLPGPPRGGVPLRSPSEGLGVVECIARHARLGSPDAQTASRELTYMHRFASSYAGARRTLATRKKLVERTARGGSASQLQLQHAMQLLGYSPRVYATALPTFVQTPTKRFCHVR